LVEFSYHMRSSYDSALDMFHSMAGTQVGASVHRLPFLRTCRGLALPLDADTAEYAFDGFDADQDGEVTSSEFLGTFFLEHLFQTPEAIEAVGAVSGAAAVATAASSTVGHSSDTHPTIVSDAQTTPAPAVVARPPWQPPLSFESFRARIEEPLPVVFSRMDVDGDAFVSHEEFLAWSRGCSPPLSDSEAEYAFLGLDENHDRWLSSSELAAALSAGAFFHGEVAALPGSLTVEELRRRIGLASFSLPGASADDAASVVRDLDANRDGLVDLWEFADAASNFAVPMTSTQAQYAFSRIDENGDHRLSTPELEQVFRTGHFSSPGGNSVAAL